MIRNFTRATAILGVVAVSSMALAACSGSGSSQGGDYKTDIAGLSGQSGELVGEGASSQQNAMEAFKKPYAQAVEGASLAYNASGSGSGRKNFIAGQTDFAGSDSPLADDQIEPAKKRCGGNDAWHLPFVIGPVAIAYNLEGVEGLNLSVDTIAKIFKGEIKKWNDKDIAKDNEGVELPDQDISVIYRSDESGTSDNFQKFLKAATDGQWDTEGQQFPQGVGSGASGSNGVASEVTSIPGAITYVEYGYAMQNGLGVANIDFGSGPVTLNDESVNAALDNLTFLSEGHDMVVDSDALFSQKAAGTYPLILTTYEIVCSAGYDQETQNRVKDFLKVALENQDMLEQLGFIPVKGTHHERLAAAVDAIGTGA